MDPKNMFFNLPGSAVRLFWRWRWRGLDAARRIECQLPVDELWNIVERPDTRLVAEGASLPNMVIVEQEFLIRRVIIDFLGGVVLQFGVVIFEFLNKNPVKLQWFHNANPDFVHPNGHLSGIHVLEEARYAD